MELGNRLRRIGLAATLLCVGGLAQIGHAALVFDELNEVGGASDRDYSNVASAPTVLGAEFHGASGSFFTENTFPPLDYFRFTALPSNLNQIIFDYDGLGEFTLSAFDGDDANAALLDSESIDTIGAGQTTLQLSGFGGGNLTVGVVGGSVEELGYTATVVPLPAAGALFLGGLGLLGAVRHRRKWAPAA